MTTLLKLRNITDVVVLFRRLQRTLIPRKELHIKAKIGSRGAGYLIREEL